MSGNDMNAEQGGSTPEGDFSPVDTGSAEALDTNQSAVGETPTGDFSSQKPENRDPQADDSSKIERVRQDLKFDSKGNFVMTPATVGGPSVVNDPKSENILNAQIPGRPVGERGAPIPGGVRRGGGLFGGLKKRVLAAVVATGLVMGGGAAYVANQSADSGDRNPGGVPTQPVGDPEGTSTSTPKVETPVITNTPEDSTITNTPEATKEPTIPLWEREGFPYEVVEVKEYEGTEVNFFFGIEKSTYERAENNSCKEIGDNGRDLYCPPIRKFELSDEYLRQYAPEQFPNGMSQEEMIQATNDMILKMFIFDFQQKGFYKDLTLEKLKEMIHKGEAPQYTQSFANGDSISYDLNNLYLGFIMTDETSLGKSANTKTASGGTTIDYHRIDEGNVFGIWSGTSSGIDDDVVNNDGWNRQRFIPSLDIQKPFYMMIFDGEPQDSATVNKILTIANDTVVPVMDEPSKNVAGIVVISK